MRKYLVIDIVALLVYLVVANPVFTGIGIHEWLGLGLFVVFLIHVVMHIDWVGATLRGKKNTEAANENQSLARKGNLILDVLVLIVFAVVTVSGMGISGTVLPTFGLYVDGYYFWNPLHSISAKILLALLLLHIALHWKWIIAAVKTRRDADHD